MDYENRGFLCKAAEEAGLLAGIGVKF